MLVNTWVKRFIPLGILLVSLTAAVTQAEPDTSSSHSSRLEIEIPKLSVAEYHRPYIAAWVTNNESKAITNLALWYQIDDDRKGEKWLKDLRQWWRKSGRKLDMPVDGFTGATRAVGQHTIALDTLTLKPGSYTLFVEASREVGGREVLQIPFNWPVKKEQTLKAEGASELGDIALTLIPKP
ncbi:hypothetical protein TDB9533_04711 [Thalassocella blandensis]|nr:hypothetical protein TDB9533_04711 [Thalassocella blandensis]